MDIRTMRRITIPCPESRDTQTLSKTGTPCPELRQARRRKREREGLASHAQVWLAAMPTRTRRQRRSITAITVQAWSGSA
eukprot:2934158-Rhodomonas_salina.2